MGSEEQKELQIMGLFASSFTVLITCLWFVILYKTEVSMALKMIKYDVNMATSGDFTVELKLPPVLWTKWKMREAMQKTNADSKVAPNIILSLNAMANARK